jgi:hypothetical protein
MRWAPSPRSLQACRRCSAWCALSSHLGSNQATRCARSLSRASDSSRSATFLTILIGFLLFLKPALSLVVVLLPYELTDAKSMISNLLFFRALCMRWGLVALPGLATGELHCWERCLKSRGAAQLVAFLSRDLVSCLLYSWDQGCRPCVWPLPSSGGRSAWFGRYPIEKTCDSWFDGLYWTENVIHCGAVS